MAKYSRPDQVAEVQRFGRIQPFIARMGQAVGFYWYQLSVEARAAIMEAVDGSTGLDEKIVEWAREFDDIREEREKIIPAAQLPGGDDFMDHIAGFTDIKIKSLLAEARLSQ